MDRLDRNVRFFGTAGQARLRECRVAVVGLGGLGSHVVQQLAYLGVGSMSLIDDEELDLTNRNRYVSAEENDPIPGSRKTDLAVRLVSRIDRSITVIPTFANAKSKAAFSAITAASHLFGCVDNDGARLVLSELCAAYQLPYFDVATEIKPGAPSVFGGRVCVALGGDGCLVCLDQLDLKAAQIELESDTAQKDRLALYGVDAEELGRIGPSVVSLNGVVASLAVTEFMVEVTGIRKAKRLLTYRADLARVTTSLDLPGTNCYLCKEVFGSKESSNIDRYLAN